MQYIHAMTRPDNIPAKALLSSMEFIPGDVNRNEAGYTFYVLERE